MFDWSPMAASGGNSSLPTLLWLLKGDLFLPDLGILRLCLRFLPFAIVLPITPI